MRISGRSRIGVAAGVALLAGVLAVFLLLWSRARHREEVDRCIAKATKAEADYLFGNLDSRLTFIVNDLLERFRHGPPQDQADHEATTQSLVSANPFLQTVNYIGPDRRIRFVSPLEANRAVIGLRIEIPEAKAALEEARRSGRPCLSEPFAIVQGQTGYSLMTPHGDGFLEVVFRADAAFGPASPLRRDPDLTVSVTDGSTTAFESAGYRVELQRTADHESSSPGSVLGRPMLLSCLPSEQCHSAQAGFWRSMVIASFGASLFFLAVMVAVLLSLLARYDRTQSSLRASEERYRSFVENFQGIAFRGRMDFTPVFFHGAVEGITGYTEQEFLAGRPRWDQVVHPDDFRGAFAEEADKVRTVQGYSTEREYRIVRKDGAVRWVRESIRNICDELGKPATVQGAITDVTDRRRAEEQMRVANERLQYLLAGSPAVIYTARASGNYGATFISDNVSQMVGFEGRRFLGSDGFWLDRVHPGDREHVLRECERIGVQDVHGYEYRFRCRDGSYIHVRDEMKLVRDEDGAPLEIVGYWADVTDHKRVEQEREALIAELEAKNAELERFVYTASHDLKSPLITIAGFMALLRKHLDAGNAEGIEDDLRRIEGAANRMKLLLDELLELSRIGCVVGEPCEAPLGDLVREATEALNGPLSARAVRVDVAPELPVLHGDRARLLEVLQNLIENAVKFMGDQPSPAITVGARRQDEETVCFVRDNGVGIEPRFHEKVFDLFDKLDRNTEGAGVGLALVKRIVEVHGGRVWVESEGAGKGTTFCFTVPAKPATDALGKQEQRQNQEV